MLHLFSHTCAYDAVDVLKVDVATFTISDTLTVTSDRQTPMNNAFIYSGHLYMPTLTFSNVLTAKYVV